MITTGFYLCHRCSYPFDTVVGKMEHEAKCSSLESERLSEGMIAAICRIIVRRRNRLVADRTGEPP